MHKLAAFLVLILVTMCYCRHHEDFKPEQQSSRQYSRPRHTPLRGYSPRNRREAKHELVQFSHPPNLYYHMRPRRQVDTYGNLGYANPGGIRGTLGASTNIFNKNGRRFDANAQVSRNFMPRQPTEYGGGLSYAAPNGGASVLVNHARQVGTNLNLEGRGLLYQSRDRNTRLDGNVNYNQNFGPRSRPDMGGGLTLIHRF